MTDEAARPLDGVPKDLSIRAQGKIWASPNYRSDCTSVVITSFAVIAAVLLRWSGLDSQSLWMDEGYTLWISRFSPQQIWHALSIDTSPPLYYILLHYWLKCLGTSAISLRALSALFGTLSILLVYLLARKILADSTSVALAMSLYAVSFYQIWYAKEARCYALLVFLSLGSVYCLLLCLENQNRLRLCCLVLFLTAGLYTHNMALFYLPGIAVMWMVYPGERTILARVKDALLAFSAVFLLYIPWLPTLRRQLQMTHGNYWRTVPTVRGLLGSLCVFLGFDIESFKAILHDRLHIRTPHPSAAVAVLFVLCVLGGLYRVHPADRRKVASLLLYSLAPILLAFVYSHCFNPIYDNRVFIGSCFLLSLVLCVPIAFQVGNRRKVFQVVGLLVLAGTVISTVEYPRWQRREDWRGVTEYLMKLPERQRLVVIVPDNCQVLVQFYASSLRKSYLLPEMTGLLTKFDPPDPTLLFRILSGYGHKDVSALLSQAMVTGRYKEIDVAMLPNAYPPSYIEPALEHLAASCASVEVVEFHRLEVRRCFVRAEY